MLLDVVDAVCLEQDQDRTAKAAAHHAGANHAGHLGGELHQRIKLPAAYLEITLQARVRGIKNRPECAGVVPPQRRDGLQHAAVLADHMTGTAAVDRIVDTIEVILLGVTQAAHTQGSGCRLAFGAPLVIGRRRQLMMNAGVRQQPAVASVRKRHLLAGERPAIQQYGLARCGLERRELIHDAGPRADEAVFGRLAEQRNVERGHRHSTRRQYRNGDGNFQCPG